MVSMLRKKTQIIMGHKLPSPRVTRDGFIMMMTYFALPLMTVLVGIDALLYLYFRYAHDTCYGVWCWF